MRFVVDAQLPPALAAWLRDQGEEAQHLMALEMLGAKDSEIWALALATPSVVITKDHDFAEWAFQRQPAPQVVWLRFGNMPRDALIERFSRSWPRILIGLANGSRLVQAH